MKVRGAQSRVYAVECGKYNKAVGVNGAIGRLVGVADVVRRVRVDGGRRMAGVSARVNGDAMAY